VKIIRRAMEFIKLDGENKRFVLNVTKQRFQDAPGFNSDHWPNMADQTWVEGIHTYYQSSGHELPH